MEEMTDFTGNFRTIQIRMEKGPQAARNHILAFMRANFVDF
jgi:hypothetical protein